MSKDEVEWIYNALDCCVTHEIFSAQEKNLDAIARNTEEFSLSLMAPVMEMQLRGVRIDEAARRESLDSYRRDHSRVQQNLIRIVEQGIGFPGFNYRSNKQLLTLFYSVLGLKPIKGRSASGAYVPVANRDALEKLQSNWIAVPLCKSILTLRELDKKINFLETPRDDDGRLRSSYNIAGTNTGRLSSSENDFGTGTNQQNIERKLRKVFIPDDGYKFCNVDLEQADARNVGAICWETFVESHGEAFAGSYLDACESGDLHTTVCRMAWRDLSWGEASNYRSVADGVAYRDMSYRDLAKRLGHGTNYYGTPRTMGHHTKVATNVISLFQERYFAAFPVLGRADHAKPKWNGESYEYGNWHQYVRYCLEHHGYILTPIFNRRRFFYGRPDDDATLREAIAYAPQSMTADEINTVMLALWRRFPWLQILNQVHDSILFQYPEERESELPGVLAELQRLLTFKLKKGREFCVPLEAKVGWNWADSAEDNPSGLVKWRGSDTRKRPKVITPRAFNIREALDG